MFPQRKQQLTAEVPNTAAERVISALTDCGLVTLTERKQETEFSGNFSKNAVNELCNIDALISKVKNTLNKLAEIGITTFNQDLEFSDSFDFHGIYEKITNLLHEHKILTRENDLIRNELETLAFYKTKNTNQTSDFSEMDTHDSSDLSLPLFQDSHDSFSFAGICEDSKIPVLFQKIKRLTKKANFAVSKSKNGKTCYAADVSILSVSSNAFAVLCSEYSLFFSFFNQPNEIIDQEEAKAECRLLRSNANIEQHLETMREFVESSIPNLKQYLKKLMKRRQSVAILSNSEFNSQDNVFVVRGTVNISDIEKIQKVVSEANRGNEQIVKLKFDSTEETREENKGINTDYYNEPFTSFFTGMMIGDFGYGIIILLVYVLALLISNNRVKAYLKEKKCLILSMIICTIYCGFIYGQFFGVNISLARSQYAYDEATASYVKKGTCIFGFDSAWLNADNGEKFINSMKFKISVIFGILHLYLSLLLQLFKYIRNGETNRIISFLIPKFLFITSSFGYFCFLMIFKWIKKADVSFIRIFYNIVTFKFNENNMYKHERIVEYAMLICFILGIFLLVVANSFFDSFSEKSCSLSPGKSLMYIVFAFEAVISYVLLWGFSLFNNCVSKMLMNAFITSVLHAKINSVFGQSMLLFVSWLGYSLSSILIVSVCVISCIFNSRRLSLVYFSYFTSLY